MKTLLALVVLASSLLWAQTAFASFSFDGNCTSNSGNPESCPITTTNANDVIVVIAWGGGGSALPTISDTALSTWTTRQSGSWTVASPCTTGGGPTNAYAVFYTTSAAPLSSDSISVSFPGLAGRIVAFAVSGANTTTPFDANGSLPAEKDTNGTGATSLAITSLSTTTANDLLIASLRTCGGGTSPGTITLPSGFTEIFSIGSSSTDASYDILAGTLSSATETYSWATSTQNLMLFDAIRPVGGGAPSTNNFFMGFP